MLAITPAERDAELQLRIRIHAIATETAIATFWIKRCSSRMLPMQRYYFSAVACAIVTAPFRVRTRTDLSARFFLLKTLIHALKRYNNEAGKE
jgi:hypothetical protein